MTNVVEVKDLVVEYRRRGQNSVLALDGASLTIERGQTVALVGESGSGKSTFASAIGALLPINASMTSGDLLVDGASLRDIPAHALRRLRREQLGFVFQDPRAALDPTKRIGKQIAMAVGQKRSPDLVRDHLTRVRLDDWERVARAFPHQISGGMAQRVAIAIAMIRNPSLLVADEPSAALDAQVRGLVLDVVFRVIREAGSSMLLLSHDLVMAARRCERLVVMYAGRVVEDGPAQLVSTRPRHPYTEALLRSVPANAPAGQTLHPISGTPPTLQHRAQGCAFAPRCPRASQLCVSTRPEPTIVDERTLLCHHPLDDAPVHRVDIGKADALPHLEVTP